MRNLGMKLFVMICALLTIAVSMSVAYGVKSRSHMLTELDTYASTGKPNAELVADFSACLKRQTVFLPFRAIECGAEMNEKYGPLAMSQIDAVVRSFSDSGYARWTRLARVFAGRLGAAF